MTETSHEMDDDEFDLNEENLEEWMRLIQTYRARRRCLALGSPKDIQQQNLMIVLDWLYKWGFSTADIISDLLNRKNRSHARRLAEIGWLRPVSVRGYPTYYVLAERGLAEALHHSTRLHEYKEVDPYRVSLPKLHHDLVTQRETIKAMNNGGYQGFLTERMYNFEKDRKPYKIPDVILPYSKRDEFNHEIIELTGLEIELTPKWGHHLDMFVTNILDDIQELRLDYVIVISDSKAVLKRYKDAFEPKTKVKRWEKSGIKFVDTGQLLNIPEWVTDRVIFGEVDGRRIDYPTSYFP